MALDQGASHTLTGQGQTAIESPAALRLAVAAAPSWAGEDFGTPPRFHDLGRLNLGNVDGWLPAVELLHEHQLMYPLPAGLTLLAWTLAPGVDVTAVELLGAVDGGGGDPGQLEALQAQLAAVQTQLDLANVTIADQAETIIELQSTGGGPTGPIVSNIAVTHGASTFTVTWDTDVPADGQLEYGGTAAYGQLSAYSATLETSHSVTVTGLQPQTQYHVRPRSSAPYTGLGADQVLTTDADPTLLYSGSLVAPAPGTNSVYTTDAAIPVGDWPIEIAVHNDAAAGGGTLTGGAVQCTGNGLHIAGSFVTEVLPGATWSSGTLDYSIASCDSPLMVTCNADGVHAIPWTVTVRRAA